MKVTEMVKQLESLGFNVKTYQRYDVRGRKRGILITQINGTRYTGASGNKVARDLLNVEMSDYQKQALHVLNTPDKKTGKVTAPKDRKKAPIPEDVTKKMQRIQRQYRKKGKEYGEPTLKKYRWNVANKGKEEADRLLNQAEKYVKGIVYKQQVDAFILRLSQFSVDQYSQIEELKQIIGSYPEDKLTHEQWQMIIESYYEMLYNTRSSASRQKVEAELDKLVARVKQIL